MIHYKQADIGTISIVYMKDKNTDEKIVFNMQLL